jgi:hypothetical protein
MLGAEGEDEEEEERAKNHCVELVHSCSVINKAKRKLIRLFVMK